MNRIQDTLDNTIMKNKLLESIYIMKIRLYRDCLTAAINIQSKNVSKKKIKNRLKRDNSDEELSLVDSKCSEEKNSSRKKSQMNEQKRKNKMRNQRVEKIKYLDAHIFDKISKFLHSHEFSNFEKIDVIPQKYEISNLKPNHDKHSNLATSISAYLDQNLTILERDNILNNLINKYNIVSIKLSKDLSKSRLLMVYEKRGEVENIRIELFRRNNCHMSLRTEEENPEDMVFFNDDKVVGVLTSREIIIVDYIRYKTIIRHKVSEEVLFEEEPEELENECEELITYEKEYERANLGLSEDHPLDEIDLDENYSVTRRDCGQNYLMSRSPRIFRIIIGFDYSIRVKRAARYPYIHGSYTLYYHFDCFKRTFSRLGFVTRPHIDNDYSEYVGGLVGLEENRTYTIINTD